MMQNKEESIKIITKHLNWLFDKAVHEKPNDTNNSEYWKPYIALNLAPKIYKELTTIKETPCNIPIDHEDFIRS